MTRGMPLGRNEADFTRSVLMGLSETKRVMVWRNNVGVSLSRKGAIRYGLAGMSDIMGITLDGTARFISIELKGPDGKLSVAQKNWRTRMLFARVFYTMYKYVPALSWDENVAECVAHTVRHMDAEDSIRRARTGK